MLPERASLDYLKKLAKERLRALRQRDPDAKLAAAQLAVAREHGFPSWRALKAEVDRRQASAAERFLAACAIGDLAAIGDLLDRDPGLVTARRPGGATGLHLAIPHPEAVRLLLARGADPNAREEGDNAVPLHFAAGGGHLEAARLLLDAGADPQGEGDRHRLDTVGWATVFAEPRREIVDLLVARGARHHVFSAIALGDRELLRRVVAGDPDALRRRLSRSEQEQTALHYVVAPPDGLLGGTFRTGDHHRTLELLIALGADLEATDAKGRTALDLAMLLDDREAARILHAAGARIPAPAGPPPAPAPGSSIRTIRPMLAVSDVAGTIAWYRAVGFELRGTHEDGGRIDWAAVGFGSVEVMLVPGPERLRGVSLWIDTDRLDEHYAFLKRRQLDRARAALAGETGTGPEVRFTVDLHTAFYGQREFGLRDPNGVELYFCQPLE